MKIDSDRIDDAVLALLHLGLHDKCRTWKGFDWDAMNRLHEKGYISDPVGKTKSVVFTEDGLRRSQELFREMFMINGGKGTKPLHGGGAGRAILRKPCA